LFFDIAEPEVKMLIKNHARTLLLQGKKSKGIFRASGLSNFVPKISS
jgi:hypothetical protein